MSTFVVTSQTNYGEVVYIVNAPNIRDAMTLAQYRGAWNDSEIEKIDINNNGVVGIYGGDGG